MRPIKFRAWIKDEKRYVNVDTLYLSKEKVDDIGNFDQDCILEQFIDSYDGNGKEIYEGDIIQYKYIDKIGDQNKLGIAKVVFGDGKFWLYPVVMDFGHQKEDWKVIGNDNQNPELLKEKIKCLNCGWIGTYDQLINSYGLDEIPEECPACWMRDFIDLDENPELLEKAK